MAAVPQPDYVNYFAGCDRAVAITIRKPKRLRIKVPLVELRATLGDFQPPQSFRYVPLYQALALLRDVRSGATQLSLPA
jgi:predicted transcriptional regulator